VNVYEVVKKKHGVLTKHLGLVRRCNLRHGLCTMTVLNIYSLCMLQLSVISLNCYHYNLDSNSDEPHDLSVKILVVGN
jgi:hypothetical protein